jgi:hypothetical protein
LPERISTEVGGMPLAVAQIGDHTNEFELLYKQFLDIYRQNKNVHDTIN